MMSPLRRNNNKCDGGGERRYYYYYYAFPHLGRRRMRRYDQHESENDFVLTNFKTALSLCVLCVSPMEEENRPVMNVAR